MRKLFYTIPNRGPVSIPLYPPADQVYDLLRDAGEIRRLAKLEHVGALTYAYPGVSHTRWDYTVSMLYVVMRLRRLVTNSSFSLGSAGFSSVPAALQCLALLANIGHLPGVYCVEKGVTQFLSRHNKDDPLLLLFRTARGMQLGRTVYNKALQTANELLRHHDYLVLNRILGVLKLGEKLGNGVRASSWLLRDLYAPFVLPDLRSPNPRWEELNEFFHAARRLAYLNHDTTLVASPISVDLSPLLSSLVDPEGLTHGAFYQSKEIIAAYEHTVYGQFYHAPDARKVSAITALRVSELLGSESDPGKKILEWVRSDNVDLIIPWQQLGNDFERTTAIGSFSLRSLFPTFPEEICQTEERLRHFLRSAAASQVDVAVGAHRYVPPEPEHAIEPDHVHVDAFAIGRVHASNVGRLIHWVADELDGDAKDTLAWLAKPEMGKAYEGLLARMAELAWPSVRLQMKPWPLSRVGKLRLFGEARDNVSIWLTSRDLGDNFTRHLVRRNSNVPSGYVWLRDELHGLGQLRA